MFIKLTNLDNQTTLINSNFLLAVEPNETGSHFQMYSSLFGDVKETPEEILRLIKEAENGKISQKTSNNRSYTMDGEY